MDVNIIVIGMIAARYCSSSYESPQLGWGAAYVNNSIVVGDTEYRSTWTNRRLPNDEVVNGVEFIVVPNAFKGNSVGKVYFIPADALKNVTVKFSEIYDANVLLPLFDM